MTLRLAFTLALLLAVGACGGETADVPDGRDWIVDADVDTTGAAALLGMFADGTVPDAFERLARDPYIVGVTLADLVPGSGEAQGVAPDTLGVFQQSLEVLPGSAPRVVRTASRGTLADSATLDASRLLPSDPFPALISGDAPFIDPRTRGAYRLDVTPVPIGDQFTLRVADETADRPLVRTATARRMSAGGTAFSIQRTSRSAIYDETSSASVVLQSLGGAPPLPRAVGTSFETATPGRRRWLVTEWTIWPGLSQGRPESGQPLGQSSADDE